MGRVAHERHAAPRSTKEARPASTALAKAETSATTARMGCAFSSAFLIAHSARSLSRRLTSFVRKDVADLESFATENVSALVAVLALVNARLTVASK
jgi:hypothetical protein